jgi:hypothetical protein
MTSNTLERNKALVLEAFDTLFNKRDYEAASRFWADKYIQHSAHIEPGREGLFRLIRSLPDSLRYEHGLILRKATTSSSTDAFRALDDPRHGSPPTWCGSRTASWRSIGTYFRTRRAQPNRRADCPCSATAFPHDAHRSEDQL